MYQRLGLEDDIVDPSNTLLREGPVFKISFRRNDPMERYLFLVGGCWELLSTPGREVEPLWPESCCLASTWHCRGTGKRPFLCPFLLWHPDDFGQVTCCLQASEISNLQVSQTCPRKQQSQSLNLVWLQSLWY